MLVPVVMAGGSGSRLWPLSRELMPKQFLTLMDKRSLLQNTLARLTGLGATKPLVICNEDHRFITAEQLRQCNQLHKNIMLEPVGRNTAPAIAAAAQYTLQTIGDAILLVLPADHFIADTPKFQQAVRAATPLAANGQLVTFGIQPTAPETGYGYIKRGTALAGNTGAYRVSQFIEKPASAQATLLCNRPDVYWNSGIFMFKASVYLQELQIHRPDIYQYCLQALTQTEPDMDFIRLNNNAFSQCPAESIDYAIMEKTDAAVVVPIETGWSDIGSWSSLWQLSKKDHQGNACTGTVIQKDSKNNLIYAESSLIATVGLEHMIVIQTADAVLVAEQSQAQQIKEIVRQLSEQGRTEHHAHWQVYRPWGKYQILDQGEGYQVKRITVLPGEKLSLQKHQHRAEHWVVVSGEANITVDNTQRTLSANQSVYIAPGTVHALENATQIPLELIEVQTGHYLGEDDIVRYTDRYGRT